jgi:serine/threonine-protein phosphatase PGAM5
MLQVCDQFQGKLAIRNRSVHRTLILVRHGEFSLSTLGLTRIGRSQAALAGRRLRHVSITRIHCSTMKRAHETALIIARHHKGRLPIRTHLLRESTPSLPRSRRKLSPDLTVDMIRRGRDRADRAYLRFFRRPGRRDECELLVCHGNVIRYWIGRVLGLSMHGWYQLDSTHCGITVIRIPREGAIVLERYNDIGHLQPRRPRSR